VKITTTRMILGAALLIAISQGENVRNSMEKNSSIRQEQSDFQDRVGRIELNHVKPKHYQRLHLIDIATIAF
jgi:hypothetical protein